MLQYISAGKYRHLNRLFNLWNSEFKSMFPIKKTLYKDKILEDADFNKDASFVALYDNEPVGFIFIKTWLRNSGFATELDTAYVSLIFVKKEMRNMGIGSDMLQLAIDEIRKHKTIRKLVVGNETNRIFSGVPNELVNAPIFFMNKGFTQKEFVVDMISVVREGEKAELDYKDLEVRIATEDEKDEILKLCVKNNWNREAYLIDQYFEHGGSGRRMVLGLINNHVVAFSRFDDSNKLAMKTSAFSRDKVLGSVFYVDVDKEYEGKGYDVVIDEATRNYLIKRGCKKVVVLATNKIAYYKNLGYSAFKYYLQFEKAI